MPTGSPKDGEKSQMGQYQNHEKYKYQKSGKPPGPDSISWIRCYDVAGIANKL